MKNNMISTKNVVKTTVLIAALSVIAKLVGFFRELSIAYVFGASASVDAYVVALTLPTMLFAIVGAALSVTAVPIFAEYTVRDEKEQAFRLFSGFTILVAIVLTGLTVVSIPAAGWIIGVLAPKLDSSTAALASQLLTIMLPGIVFFCLANLFYGILNANNVFGPPAIAPAVITLCTIGGVLLGFRYGIQAAAFGTLAGFIGAMALQIPYLIRSGFRLYKPVSIFHPGMKEAFTLMVPMMIGSGISQIYLLIDRFFASGLPVGSIAALNYAVKLMLLPQGIIVTALGTAVFPMLSAQAAEKSYADFGRSVGSSLKGMALIALPCGVALAFLREPIIDFLFLRGAFDHRAAVMTSYALLCFSFGLIGQCLNPILTRGFYAMQDTITPVKIGILGILVNLLCSILLIKPMQLGGLALATSIAATVSTIVLYIALCRKAPGMAQNRMGLFVGKALAASMLAGGCAWGLDTVLARDLTAGMGQLFVRLSLDGTAGLITFLLFCRIMRLDAYLQMRSKVLVWLRCAAARRPAVIWLETETARPAGLVKQKEHFLE